MRLSVSLATLGLPLLAAGWLACSKPAEPTPAPAPAPAPAQENGPGTAQAAPQPPSDAPVVVATVAGVQVTDDDVFEELARERIRGPVDAAQVRAALDVAIGEVLLANEAKEKKFSLPSGIDADDRHAVATAWGRELFLANAKAAVTDAQLEQWFGERRGMARASFDDEGAAKAFRKALVAELAAHDKPGIAMFRRVERKQAGKRRPHKVVPDGVLVDRQGKTELDVAVLPPQAAEALFALAKDGDVTEPVALGDGKFVVVARFGTRPATPLTEVPEGERERARDALAAAQAQAQVVEYAARLRAGAEVTIDDSKLGEIAANAGRGRMMRLRGLGAEVRRMQLERMKKIGDDNAPPPLMNDMRRERMMRRPVNMQGPGGPSSEPPASGAPR